jgi:Mg2+ and Co2+ transporter CorA
LLVRKAAMTQKVQRRSLAVLTKPKPKPKTRDIKDLLLSMSDNLNELRKALSRLEYAVQRKIDLNLSQKGKGEKDES